MALGRNQSDRFVLGVALVAAAAAMSAVNASAVQAQDSGRERARLEAVLAELNSGNISLEELEAIPSAAQSSELRYILQDRAQAQSEFREDSQIEDLLSRIESIETVAIPTVIRGLIANLSAADGARD